MIFTTPRASCSMKSLRAHRASILVACSPTINNDSDIAKHLLHSNLCFLPAKTLGACSHPELVPSGNNHFRNLEHLSHHTSPYLLSGIQLLVPIAHAPAVLV